jgi:hypothetical protein
MNIINLEKLKKTIEKLSKYHQQEIYKIIKKSGIDFDENNNGSFINLSQVPTNTVNDLMEYTKYVETQQEDLLIHENEKKTLEKKYFNKI